MSITAGSLALQIGEPSTNPEAQAKNAVLIVRGYACVAPEKTTVSATAEGIVNGKHQSIPLKLIPLSGESTYALTRQWPTEGKWVITLVEANPRFDLRPSAIVKVDGDAIDWAGITRSSPRCIAKKPHWSALLKAGTARLLETYTSSMRAWSTASSWRMSPIQTPRIWFRTFFCEPYSNSLHYEILRHSVDGWLQSRDASPSMCIASIGRSWIRRMRRAALDRMARHLKCWTCCEICPKHTAKL
jgi:hypothetical protein